MYDEIIDELMKLVQDLTTMPIRRAALPAAEGISLEKSASDTISTCLNRSTVEEISCVLNAKSRNMRTALCVLERMHVRLTRLPIYPKTDKWQMVSVETISGPSVIGREAGDQWLVVSSIRVKIYNKESAY